MPEKDNTRRGNLRKICFIFYFVLLEIIAVGCLALSAISMNYEPIVKLQIWDQFDQTMPNLPPILTLVASVLMILVPIVGMIGVIKNNQITITVFACLMTVVTFLWLAIGAWCISLHSLIMNDMEIKFARLERDGQSVPEAQQFLLNLKNFLPRLNARNNFICCQGPEGQVRLEGLYICAKDCGFKYASLFETIVFPSLFATVFGASTACVLSLLTACLVCCHLDDVNPAF